MANTDRIIAERTRDAELIVLGCGTSTGVPIPGCDCAVCTSQDPKNTRLRTSAYITFPNGEALLVDASPDLRAQSLANHIRHVDGVFYTHAHADHILGTDDLRVFNFRRSGPIPCYGSTVTTDLLKKFFGYIFEPDPSYEGGALANLSIHPLRGSASFQFAGTAIHPIELYHGSLPVLGLRIGELAYATDCNCIPESSLDLMRGVKVLFLDGLRYEHHPTHFTIDQAVAIAQQIGAEKTYLIHMTHNIDYHEVNKKLPKGVELAFDGLRVQFSV
ncbi:MAG: MBL fold metallo-hydrolase [Bdellovibrionales bacterium]|nr:MBL fold metallo-hydrolase [Bdellovibrionales bacterium]